MVVQRFVVPCCAGLTPVFLPISSRPLMVRRLASQAGNVGSNPTGSTTYASVAQLVEQPPFKRQAVGSSPI